MIFTIVPEFLMRFLSWVLVRALYRLRAARHRRATCPTKAPALLVCNHVSYMDALILAASDPAAGALRHVLQDLQHPGDELDLPHRAAIPIAGAREDPELMERAFDEIDAALADGEIVGIFPEGALTRDGEIAAFKSGVERILATAAGAGGADGAARHVGEHVEQARRALGPAAEARLRARIELVAAPPVDGAAATAAALEALVRALRGDKR